MSGRRTAPTRLRVLPSRQAPAVARAWTQDRLATGRAPAPLSEDAVLVVSELVTNAVRAGARSCSVELQLDAEAIDIVVFDDAPGSPRFAAADDLAEHGR